MRRRYTPNYKKPSTVSDWSAWLREDLEGFLDAVGMATDATTEEERADIRAWARDRFVDAIENLRGLEQCFGPVEQEAFERGRQAGAAEAAKARKRPTHGRAKVQPSNVVDLATVARRPSRSKGEGV